MIENYLFFARKENASDVHLTVDMVPMMRVTGYLEYMSKDPLTKEHLELLIDELLNKKQKEKLLLGEDVDFAYADSKGQRYRINIYRQRGNFAIAIRLLNSHIPSLEELGLPSILADIALKQRGLILVTGPTGSGKSTTLASMIDVINETKRSHILTLEDPIEYMHKHKKALVNQREIGVDAYSFAHSLRSALREDPDVILVGEMRDYETMALALTAAETGHLVLSTLHTTSAAQTIDRIIDVFPPNQQNQVKSQLSTSLNAIIAQRLLPNIDENNRCAALEIMINNEATANMIREGKTYQINSVIQTSANCGMQTMDMALAKLVLSKNISIETAIQYCNDEDNLKRLIGIYY